jgi:predicted RNA binding protein YcfA (HicA-like mRNA interferase family)
VSPALPAVSSRTVVKALVSVGFVHVSTSGSHAKVARPDGRTAVVPMHGGRDIPRGPLGSILRQAGLTAAEFRNLVSAEPRAHRDQGEAATDDVVACRIEQHDPVHSVVSEASLSSCGRRLIPTSVTSARTRSPCSGRTRVFGHYVGYGLVVADECHHIPAAGFEDAVKQIPTRRWLGLPRPTSGTSSRATLNRSGVESSVPTTRPTRLTGVSVPTRTRLLCHVPPLPPRSWPAATAEDNAGWVVEARHSWPASSRPHGEDLWWRSMTPPRIHSNAVPTGPTRRSGSNESRSAVVVLLISS